jgi:hypothetical protein
MGKKYTEYYYKISKVSNLSKEKRDILSQERKRVISDGMEIAKIFMYGDDNEIIYDNVKMKEAKGLIS